MNDPKMLLIGVMAGVIGASIAFANGSVDLRGDALDSAVKSGYLVHNGKAYQVTLVSTAQIARAPDAKCQPTVTIDGTVWPGSCPDNFTTRQEHP